MTLSKWIVLAAVICGQAKVEAQIWDGGGGNDVWSNLLNWSPDGAPVNNGTASVTFAGSTRLTPNVDTPWSINSLTYASGSGAFTLGGSALTFGSGGVTSMASTNQTISNSLILASTQTWATAANGTLTFAGALNNSAHNLTLDTIGEITVSGSITGAGGLTKVGFGELILSGANANTFSGTTIVKQGDVILSKTVGGAIPGNLVIAEGTGIAATVSSGFNAASNQVAVGGTVTVNSGGNWTASNQSIANVVINGGNVQANYGGTNFTITNALTFTGGTLSNYSSSYSINLNADVATLPSTTTATISSGYLNLGGAMRTFAVSDGPIGSDLSISSQILSGGIVKTGNGTLRLSGANGFSGGLVLQNGTLAVGNSGALGSGSVQLNGGILLADNFSTTTLANPLILGGDIAISAASGALVLNGNGTLTGDRVLNTPTSSYLVTLAGVIDDGGSGFSLNKTGAGALLLSGANSFSGQLTVGAGTLRVGHVSALGSNPLGTVVLSGGALDLNGFALAGSPLSIAGNGGTPGGALVNSATTAASWNGPISMTSAATVTAISGPLTLGGAISGAFPFTVDGSNTTTINGSLNTGSAGLIKTGSGTLLLAGTNTFAGAILVNAGVAKVGNSAALGAPTGNTVVASGAVLDLNGFAVGAEPVTISGTGGSSGALSNSSSEAASLAGPLTLGASSTIRALAGNLTLHGAIGGGFTLSVDGAFNTTLNGNVDNGAGGLTKAGAGTLSLGGIASYTGATSINAGTLRLLAGSNLAPTSALTVASGALLDLNGVNSTIGSLAGAGTVSLGAGRLTTGGDNLSSTFTGTISGSEGITKVGTGTLTLSGPNSFQGTALVNSGILRLGDPGAIPASGAGVLVATGGTFDVNGLNVGAIPVVLNGAGAAQRGALSNGSTTAASFAGPITLASDAAIRAFSGDLTLTGGITGNFPLTIDGVTSATTTTTINAVIATGTAGLIKNGGGTLVLTGAQPNTFSGRTVVNAGLLLLAKMARALAGDLTVGDGLGGSSVDIVRFGASDQIANTSAVLVNSSGWLDLDSFTNTVAGLSVVGGRVSTSTGTLNVNGDLATSPSATAANLAGSVVVAGTFANQSTSTLSGSYSVSGGVTNSSTLTLPSSANLSAGGPGLLNLGTLTFTGGTANVSGTFTNQGLMTGSGTIAGSGAFVNQSQFTTSGIVAINTAGNNLNAGNIDLAAGVVISLGGGVLRNAGTIDLKSGGIAGTAMLRNDAGGVLQGRGLVSSPFQNNGGTLIVASGTTNIVQAFVNSGVIDLREPGANLNGGVITNTGSIAGVGQVGNGITNQGTIEAVGGSLVLGGTVTNSASGLISAASGSKILFAGGLAGNAGIVSLNGGTFDNNGRPLTNTGQISGYGIVRTGGLQNNGSMTFTGGTSTISGEVTNASGKTIHVAHDPAIFSGNVVNNGTFKTTGTTTTFTGSFVNNGAFTSDPAEQSFANLAIGTTGYLAGGLGDVFRINENLLNESQEFSLWDTGLAKVSVSGGGTHLISWPGADRGASQSGYLQNFSLGIFEVSAGGSFALRDGDTTPGGALYTRVLLLAGGVGQIDGLTGNGLNIFYDPTEPENAYLLAGSVNGSYPLQGGGAILPVPEPGALGLLGVGAACLALRRRDARR